MTAKDKVRRNIKIVRLLRQGVPHHWVAEQYNLSQQAICHIAKAYGIKRYRKPDGV